MPSNSQSKKEREQILANLPTGVRRIQVLDSNGKQVYKRPGDVDLDSDYILLTSDGSPVLMRGAPGRRPKKTLTPINSQVAEVEEARQDHLGSSSLISEVSRDPDGDPLFRAILEGMAQEASVLEFQRMVATQNGEDPSHYANLRARVLKGMADTWLKRKQQLEGGMIDLESPIFRALFSMILETFKEALMASGTRPEHIETVFAKLVGFLSEDSWKQDAKVRMKGATV